MNRARKIGERLAFAIILIASFSLPLAAQQERPRTAKKSSEAAKQAAKAARVFEEIMATRERNIPRSTIDAIHDHRSDGISPDDLQIVDFTRQLLRKNRIDEPLAQAVMKRLGADQYVQLTTCIGYYAMLAMTVNAVELPPNPQHEALKV